MVETESAHDKEVSRDNCRLNLCLIYDIKCVFLVLVRLCLWIRDLLCNGKCSVIGGVGKNGKYTVSQIKKIKKNSLGLHWQRLGFSSYM